MGEFDKLTTYYVTGDQQTLYTFHSFRSLITVLQAVKAAFNYKTLREGDSSLDSFV